MIKSHKLPCDNNNLNNILPSGDVVSVFVLENVPIPEEQ